MSGKDRVGEIIRQLSAQYISREANRLSMVTVTNVEVSPDQKNATIMVSVFPEDKEHDAISFLTRHRSDFFTYVKKHSKLRRIPKFDFAVDVGEKNRQRIDELMQE